MKKITLIFLLIYFMNTIENNAQSRENSSLNQLFIDFLKTETLYHEDAAYYPYPFEDIDCGHLYKRQEVNSTEQMKQLIAESIAYDSRDSTIYYKAKLELPHYIKIDVLDNEHFHAEAFVNQPDSSATLHFNEASIGIPQCFDKTEITLLGIEGDVAYLLLEDKSKSIDYSYTRPGYEFDDDEPTENEKAEWKWKPYREGCNIDIISICGDTDDGIKYCQMGRLSAVVRNNKGAILDFKTLYEDFRHYLWYRNMDVVNSYTAKAFEELQQRFAPIDGGYLHYPLYVVRLQASGHVDNLDVTVHSHSVRPLVRLELTGKFVPRYDHYADEPTLEEMMHQIATIRNNNADSLLLKPVVATYAYHPQRNTLAVVAYLPFCYNTQKWDARLQFSSLTINSIEGIVTLEDDEIVRGRLDNRPYLSQGPYGDAIDIVTIPTPISSNDTLRGELRYYYPDYEATRYDLPRLPMGWRYEEESHTLFIPRDDFNYFDTNNGYDDQGKYNPTIGDIIRTDNEYGLVFERPLKTYIVIKKVRTIGGTVPFTLALPAGSPK